MSEIGEVAPDFALLDQNQDQVTLSEFRGEKNVVLSLHVNSFTGG